MEYPYEKIVKLSEKISSMKDKKYKKDLKHIKKIIEDCNSDISMTKNDNGYFSPDFETLNYETYIKLEEYLEEIKMRNNRENSNTDTEKNLSYLSEKNNDCVLNKRLKYTNSENLILNKIKYVNAIKEHQSEYSEKKDDNIEMSDFLKIFKKNNDDNKNDKNDKDNKKIKKR